jgi:hypothetical protein
VIQHIAEEAARPLLFKQAAMEKMAAAGRSLAIGGAGVRQLLQHMTRVCHPESEVRAPINNAGRSFNDKVVRAALSKCRFQSAEHRYIFIFRPFVCLFCKWCAVRRVFECALRVNRMRVNEWLRLCVCRDEKSVTLVQISGL